MARVLMVVQHPVKDFNAWRIEYDKAQPIRDKHGVTDATVFRNADDPNEITGLHWFPSVDEAHAFADDPDLKDAMARAGVSGPPRIEISVEVQQGRQGDRFGEFRIKSNGDTDTFRFRLDEAWDVGHVADSWVVSYQEVVHAQAICEGVPALDL